ncbi:MAG: hypothetical protein K1X64_14830 [Myxococcaceae bacterium]|nr:hypothetical protein [Myxococcaceae bacterium]
MSRLVFFLCCFAAHSALAADEAVRLLLSIGSNYGAPDEPVLQFAEADAERVRDVFVELGQVEKSRATLVLRPTARVVRERLAEIAGRVTELHAQNKKVTLILFASAHGRAGQLHFTGSSLSTDELRALGQATGADLRVLVVDACESGNAVRGKGAQKGQAYALSVQVPAASGEAFIASSGSQELSQEWDTLGGSLFTHHWLTGLRGGADADRDGKVTLTEAYSYAARRTVAESVDTGQHPEFDFDLQGAQEVTLTEPKMAHTVVRFEDSLEGRFVLVRLPEANVVAEVHKVKGRPLKLALASGRYLVRRTTGFNVALQEVELPYGGTALIEGRAFVVRDFSEVAMKGGRLEFHPHAVGLSAGVMSASIAGTPARGFGALQYRFAQGSYWFSAEALFSPTAYRGLNLRTSEQRVAGRLAAGARFWWGPVVVMPGVAFEISHTRQSYVRDDEAAIQRVYGPLPDRQAWGAAVGAQLRAEAPLKGPFFISASVSGWARAMPQARAASWLFGADANLSLAVRF